jgi:hypothetical protein
MTVRKYLITRLQKLSTELKDPIIAGTHSNHLKLTKVSSSSETRFADSYSKAHLRKAFQFLDSCPIVDR